MAVDEADARRAVEAIIATWPPPREPDEEVVVWRVEDHERAWVVEFATRRWLRTREFGAQLVGMCPFVVEKSTGQVHTYGSAPEQYEKFLEWLDPPEDSAP